jgi:cyanophycinase
VIVGGGGTSEAIVAKAIELAGGVEARIVVLPQASARADTGLKSVALWTKAGAKHAQSVDLTQGAPALALIEKADLIWFPGGDQSRLMRSLMDAQAVEPIRARYLAGATIGGTSAGAAVMSRVMLTGKYRLESKKDARSEKGAIEKPIAVEGQSKPVAPETAPEADKVEPAAKSAKPAAAEEDSGLKYIRSHLVESSEGLGLLPDAIVDQHFVRRQRFNRLISAVLDQPLLIGIGIDERTAVIVTGSSFEVMGESNVLVVDARRAALGERTDGAPPSAWDVRLSLLRPGMKFDMADSKPR